MSAASLVMMDRSSAAVLAARTLRIRSRSLVDMAPARGRLTGRLLTARAREYGAVAARTHSPAQCGPSPQRERLTEESRVTVSHRGLGARARPRDLTAGGTRRGRV